MTEDGATADERSIPAAAELAREIKRRRTEAGLSQPELAGIVGYTRQYVSLAERVGKNLPSQELINALDNGLAANGALVELRRHAKADQAARRRSMAEATLPHKDVAQPTIDVESTTAAKPNKHDAYDERDPVKRRSFLAVSGAAASNAVLSPQTRVLEALEVVTSGQADSLGIAIDCLNELISYYSEKLPVSPLAEMYNGLLDIRSYGGSLLERSAVPTRQRQELVVAVGWLSNLLAVAASYLGDHKAALVWCVDAERQSNDSGHRDIAGRAALTRSMMAYYQGWTERSIELAIDGQAIAPLGTTVHAKLAAHVMRARAMLGDTAGMMQAKRQATKALAELPSDVATTGAFSIALSDDPPYTATSLLLLNRFQEAASATRRVIETAYPTGMRPRNRRSSSYARTLLILGLAEAGLGNVDDAAAAGRAALDSSGLVWPTFVLAGKLDNTLMRDHGDAVEAMNYHNQYLEVAAHAVSELQHPEAARTSKESNE